MEVSLPPLGLTATTDQVIRRAALVDHKTLLLLGEKERLASAARRLKLWMAWKDQWFRNLAIEILDPDGQPTSEYITFSEFDGYFTYLMDQWGITAPSTISTLLNGTMYLLPAAHQGLIADPETGELVSPDEILMLGEHEQQILVGVANRALNPNVTKGQPKPIETIGQALSIIHDSSSVTEAQTRLQEAGLIGSKTVDGEKFTMYSYVSGTQVFIGMAVDHLQYRKLLMVLKNLADPASVFNLDDMVEQLQLAANTQKPEEPGNDVPAEDDGAAFTRHLEGIAGSKDRG